MAGLWPHVSVMELFDIGHAIRDLSFLDFYC